MDRDTLAVGLAAVLAGLAVTMTVLALSESLFLFLIAVPFGLAAYLVWYHASGRLRAHTRRRAQAASGPRRERAARDTNNARRGAGDTTHDTRDASRGAGGGRSRFAEEARRRRARADGETDGRAGVRVDDRMSVREAYRTLGLEADASQAAVKRAYRERVKDVHPDSGGDEETFKRVTEAYERLTD